MDLRRRQLIHQTLVSLAEGDREVFPVLMAELWPAILTFAQRGMGNEADAEDVAQEVFLRICARIAEFDSRRDGVSWAFGIAAYEILTHRRRRQRRREVYGPAATPDRPDGAPAPDDRLIQQEVLQALAHVVGELSEEDRVALGMGTGAEAATGATWRKRRQRAMARLGEAWRRIYGGP